MNYSLMRHLNMRAVGRKADLLEDRLDCSDSRLFDAILPLAADGTNVRVFNAAERCKATLIEVWSSVGQNPHPDSANIPFTLNPKV